MIDFLFPLVLGEVVLGGGGRTFSIGAVSLRMLLFAAGLVATLVGMMTTSARRDGLATANLLVLAFFASVLPGLLVDASRGTPAQIVSLQLQPLLFWLSAPFFALALQDVRTVQKAAVIIIFGGLIVSVGTLFLTIGLYVGFVDFGSLYLWSERTGELFFRGFTNFFYKGHFFVGVALIFSVVLTPRWWKTMSGVLALSLALSLTRGLYLAVAIGLVLSFFSAKRQVAMLFVILGAVIGVGIYGQAIADVIFDPTRVSSSLTRSRDLYFFLATFDYNTLLFGEGTGILLNGRSNVENSFLWALWRFGILGLSFMFLPLFMCVRYFSQIPNDDEHHRLASAFFFGVVMLYVVTAFNPFVNNSIGLTYLLCAIFSLRRLGRNAALALPPAQPPQVRPTVVGIAA